MITIVQYSTRITEMSTGITETNKYFKGISN